MADSNVISIVAEKFGVGQWSFYWSRFRKSGILRKRIVHKEFGIISRTRCCWNSLKADVLFSVQRLHYPEVNSEAKGHGKLSTHFSATQETIETIFRIIVSASQLSLFGAVAELCEECENLHD